MNEFMKVALNEAKKAYKKKEVPIGAVIVKNGVIISKAHNLREKKKLSTAHAEILAIEKACKKLGTWRLDDCVMYVTLEPCMMCAGAITQARIKHVVIGALDKKNGVVESIASVFDINTTTRVEYEIINEEQCSKILSDFFKELRENKKVKKRKNNN